MKFLIVFLLSFGLFVCASLHDRTQMGDWNIVAVANNSTECQKSFVDSKLDYCCFNSTVQIKNSSDNQGNYFIFQTESGIGTTEGCKKLQKLFGYTNVAVQDPQVLFQWGENQQIIQKVKLLVSETPIIEDGITKYKYTLQIPANIINNSSDQKFLQTLEFIEVAKKQEV